MGFAGRAQWIADTLPSPLHFQRERPARQGRSLCQYLIVERTALQAQAVALGQIMDAATKNVVLGDDFNYVESVLVALQAMK